MHMVLLYWGHPDSKVHGALLAPDGPQVGPMYLAIRAVLINPSGAETRIFQDNQVNAIVVDALAPCVARPSATMVLIAGYA